MEPLYFCLLWRRSGSNYEKASPVRICGKQEISPSISYSILNVDHELGSNFKVAMTWGWRAIMDDRDLMPSQCVDESAALINIEGRHASISHNVSAAGRASVLTSAVWPAWTGLPGSVGPTAARYAAAATLVSHVSQKYHHFPMKLPWPATQPPLFPTTRKFLYGVYIMVLNYSLGTLKIMKIQGLIPPMPTPFHEIIPKNTGHSGGS